MRTTASWFAGAASLRTVPESREERGVGSQSDPWGALSLCHGFGEPCEPGGGRFLGWLRYPSAWQDGLVPDRSRGK